MSGQAEKAEREAMQQKIKLLEAELQEARDNLERQVQERTGELTKAVEELRRQMREHEVAEEALQESEEKYRLLLENSGLSVVYHDLDGKILLINTIGSRNLGGVPEDFFGKTLHDLFDSAMADTMTARGREIIESGKGSEYEDLIELPSGPRWFWSLLRPVKDSRGVIIGVQVISHDVTERKQAEQALMEARDQLERRVEKRTEELRKKSEELEMFTYFISHDLQSPLRTIEAFSQTLIKNLGDRIEEEHREELLMLRRTAENMHRLIGDMMTYARLGISDFSKAEIPLKIVLNDAQIELIEIIKERDADIRVSDSLPTVRGHERTLVRLLANLLSNAIKFVPDGRRPEISVEAARSGNSVRVSVRDNGIGIAPEYREKIFRMFERLHSRDDYPGTGVGLAIVKKAVELHGGTLGVESELGKGSTFWFEIPD